MKRFIKMKRDRLIPYFFIQLLLLISMRIQSQVQVDPSKYRIRQVKKFGENAVRIGDIYTAIDFYEYYCSKKPKKINAGYTLAELYRLSRNYVKAKNEYQLVYEADKTKYPIALYYQALMMMQLGQYSDAVSLFEQFKKEYKDKDDQALVLKKLAAINISGCYSAQRIIDSTLDITITHLDTTINKANEESAPFPLNQNTFIYSSLKLNSLTYYEKSDSSISVPLRKLYKAVKINNIWKDAGAFEGPINMSEHNTSNACISKDGKRMYFTRCGKNWQYKNICNLYVSKNENDQWQEPRMLDYPVNDPDYTSTQPTISTNAKTNNEVIYFVSDRPGGKGGYDIWYTEFNPKKNIYEPPKNAGSKINTIGNEITPYYDLDSRTLYFSSDGWPGLGGFDVFRSIGEFKNWSVVENVGYPINTSADDIYYVPGCRHNDGFFVSNRDGVIALKNPNCCDDIFYYKWNKFIHIVVTGKVYEVAGNDIVELFNNKFKLGLKVNSRNTNLGGMPVQLYYVDSKTKESFLIKTDTTDENGIYNFEVDPNKNYFVSVKNYGYFDKKINLTTRNIKESDSLKMRPIGINYIPDVPLTLNIYYEFGNDKLTDESKVVLDTTLITMMKQLPQIVVELSSHTASVGNEDYNLKLSQHRAENVVKYLESKGIAKERLQAIGYGASRPIAPNTNPDGSDNPAGRDKNRRTEIKIVGSLEQFINEDEQEP